MSESTVLLDNEQVSSRLPHRYPFLLIDTVVDLVPYQQVTCRKNVTCNEWFFPGHFPRMKVMPGVLLVEAMAQASALCLVESLIRDQKLQDPSDLLFYLTHVRNAKFSRKVVPGNTVFVKSTVVRYGSRFSRFECSCLVEGHAVANAEIAAAT